MWQLGLNVRKTFVWAQFLLMLDIKSPSLLFLPFYSSGFPLEQGADWKASAKVVLSFNGSKFLDGFSFSVLVFK